MSAPVQHELALLADRRHLILRCACGWRHEWVAPVPFGWVGHEATRHVQDDRQYEAAGDALMQAMDADYEEFPHDE